MISAGADHGLLGASRVAADLPAAMARWRAQSHSQISHHQAQCCRMARAWFMALDHSLDALQGSASAIAGPRWIQDRFAWGPSSWPLHWCEAVESAQLDCGALSALTREIYLQRGVTVAAAQVIQRYSAQTIAHWRRKWRSGDAFFDWLAGDLIYHEVVGVLLDDAILKIWDPSNTCWIAHDHTRGYGATLEIKVTPPSPSLGGATVRWGDRSLTLGSWNDLEQAASPAVGLDETPPVGP